MNSSIKTVLLGFAPLTAAACLSIAGCPVDEQTAGDTADAAQTAANHTGAADGTSPAGGVAIWSVAR